jgi:hypothetical protein
MVLTYAAAPKFSTWFCVETHCLLTQSISLDVELLALLIGKLLWIINVSEFVVEGNFRLTQTPQLNDLQNMKLHKKQGFVQTYFCVKGDLPLNTKPGLKVGFSTITSPKKVDNLFSMLNPYGFVLRTRSPPTQNGPQFCWPDLCRLYCWTLAVWVVFLFFARWLWLVWNIIPIQERLVCHFRSRTHMNMNLKNIKCKQTRST